MNTVEERFTHILSFMGIPNDQIRNEASFAKDYDFDESQFICLAFHIGLFFKINLKEADYKQINTVGDAIDFVKRKIQ